jgi:hypothetical protein
MRRTFSSAMLAASLFVSGTALADELPKTGVKLTAAEIKGLHAGKTAKWSSTVAYFAPDGKFAMYDRKKKWFGDGAWSVRGNMICRTVTVTSMGDGSRKKVDSMCWTWYKDGKTYYDLSSGEKNTKHGWFTKELTLSECETRSPE